MRLLTIVLCLSTIPSLVGQKNLEYPQLTRREAACLYTNVYHEARGEPFAGQIAVAKVTLNRAKNSSICDVVYAPKQFSWVGNNKKVKDAEAYYRAHLAAWAALRHDWGATHYHATYVKPKWAKKLTKIEQIGNHVFYQ